MTKYVSKECVIERQDTCTSPGSS